MRVGTARREDRDLRHAGNDGGHGRHHRHAGKSAFAARHVTGDGIDRRGTLAGEDPGAQFLHPELLRQLRLVEAADTVDGEFDGPENLAVEAVHGPVDIGPGCGDPVGGERRMIEFAPEAGQRLVSLALHGIDDGPHLVHIRAEIGFRALEQAGSLDSREAR